MAAAARTALSIHNAVLILTLVLALGACRRETPAGDAGQAVRTLIRQGKLKEALASAESAERAAQRGPSQVRLDAAIAKAEALNYVGRFSDALPQLEAASAIPGALPSQRVAILTQKGWALSRLGRYETAEHVLDEAFSLAAASALPDLQAEIELRRAPTLARLGRPRDAEAAGRRALDLATGLKDDYLRAAALGNLGFVRLAAYRFEEAVPYFEEALRRSEAARAPRFTASSLTNLGRCYAYLGDTERAIDLLQRAERAHTELGDPSNALTPAGVLADIHYEHGDLATAARYYRLALDLARQIGTVERIADQLNDFAQLQLSAGDVAEAERLVSESASLAAKYKLREHAINALAAAAQIQAAKGLFHEAEAGFTEAVRQAHANRYSEMEWFARAALADTQAALGKTREAEETYETALTDVERTRSKLARDGWKLTFQDRAIRFYRSYVRFLMQQGRAERALEIAEAARARLLLQKLRIYSDTLEIVPAARLREVAKATGATLVSVWLANKASYLWVITAGSIRSATLPAAAEIEPLVRAYQAAILRGRDPLATGNEAGAKLSELILRPVANLAPKSAQFIVVPDGVLYELSLDALPSPADPSRYWLEDAAVAVTPSLVLLSSGARGKQAGGESLLLIGNPSPPAKEYAALPAAAREIAELRKRFPGTVFQGADAIPSAYAGAGPARFSLIHFAAHSTANRQSPLESAVVLSEDAGRYKLYARDIIEVPIRARLVTISACRSAGARVYSGEGLVGFAWAFLQAGAENVVAGLWDVNDASTAELMNHLYGGIGQGLAPAQALRDAKLGLLRSRTAWSKPFYWAPFQIFSRHCRFR